MYDNLIIEINNIIKNEGLQKYLKNWKEIENKNFGSLDDFMLFINKEIKKFHKHSMIISNNKEYNNIDSRQLPKFYWDKKNKIGRITFHFLQELINNLKDDNDNK